ncbi:nitroreductase family protein [Alkaliflexus imshenetskii]|uniref:nitroreductase family protein n=1 Tax=Alkaliflexus imshenetskii TaxID=286730 RepID=UPI00047A0E56|nr:nitroreductase family protein [Alkaliflexus imshenetskii]
MKTLLELIQHRRSCRSFLPRAIETDKTAQLAKALLWSPSSKNNRPWDFIFVDDVETIRLLSTCKPHGASFMSGAPLAVVIVGDMEKSDVWVEDCAIAAILLQMTVESIGLGSTWVQVRLRAHDEQLTASDYIKKILNIPANLEVASIIAIGYKAKERAAYSDAELLNERIHHNRFSQD